MKFLIIGDPHGSENIFKIPEKILKEVDGIIVPGDLGKADLLRKYFFKYSVKGIDWKKELPDRLTKKDLEKAQSEPVLSCEKILKYLTKFSKVILTYGNIEPYSGENITRERNRKHGINIPLYSAVFEKLSNLEILNFRKKEVGGVKFAGVPYYMDTEWALEFTPENSKNRCDAQEQTPKVESFLQTLEKVDVLIFHIPPKGILDKVDSTYGAPEKWWGKHAGSSSILKYIKEKQPKFVICGHIHEGKGISKLGNTVIINAGVNGDYQVTEV